MGRPDPAAGLDLLALFCALSIQPLRKRRMPGIAQAPRPGLPEFPHDVHAGIGGGVFTSQRDGNGIFRAVGKGDECDGPLLLRWRLREGCASIALRKMRSICLSLFFLLFFSYLF